ncbi:ATP-dependent helicase/nuclease subunit A [Nymphon striatum]|nr:ATP-dependent helicase/nuclease subunit A [Nymphon striatum]
MERALAASGKPINAGDVLVLVRKRDAFVHALSRALKNLQVPVAGADRLSMVSHIAVLDLMALGRIMLNESDDLSLAALLRSPLFGWSDQALFDVAYGRSKAYSQLSQWKTIALNRPVYEFYSHVLGVGEARKKLVSRLGPETNDMLDEFLNFAISQERTSIISLETFLSTLENFSPVIKREMDEAQSEVRIMTVHGAKGLEAPIVFLVDPGSAAFTVQTAPSLLPVQWQEGATQIQAVLWGNSGNERSSTTADILENLKDKAEEEYRRLLYVGMTRAADQLILVGYAGKRGTGDGTWHSMVEAGLSEYSKQIDIDGHPAIHYPAVQAYESRQKNAVKTNEAETEFVLPPCFDTPVPVEPPAARPLIPSGIYGFAIEPDQQDADAEEPRSLLDVNPAKDNLSMSPQLALRRGTAIHKLLQMLPEVPIEQQRNLAQAYCGQFETRWTQNDIELICDQVFSVLNNPDYAPFFRKKCASRSISNGYVGYRR